MIDPMNKRELNFGKTLAGVWVVRDWLKKRLGPEPVTGLWLPTSVGGALANVALTMLGKTTVNLNYTAGAPALASALRQTGIRQVITSKLFVRKMPFPVPHHEAAADADKVQVIYLEDALGEIKNWQRVWAFLKVLLLPGWFLEYVLLGLGGQKLGDLATIIFSSGSTGEPKGIMLSHFNLASNIESAIAAIDLTQRDRAMGTLPFFHSFGYTILLWGPLQIGASVVYYPDPRAAKEIGEHCRTYRCNVMISTATFLRFYLKQLRGGRFSHAAIPHLRRGKIAARARRAIPRKVRNLAAGRLWLHRDVAGGFVECPGPRDQGRAPDRQQDRHHRPMPARHRREDCGHRKLRGSAERA